MKKKDLVKSGNRGKEVIKRQERPIVSSLERRACWFGHRPQPLIGLREAWLALHGTSSELFQAAK